MENRVLTGLQPERALYYFEEISRIPHGSRNTKQISDYLVGFARDHGLRWWCSGWLWTSGGVHEASRSHCSHSS